MESSENLEEEFGNLREKLAVTYEIYKIGFNSLMSLI
jgi:hypothetical protein